MKAAGFLQILILAGTLANAASASDDLSSATQATADHSHFPVINTAETDSGNDDSANQPPPVLDRRDRIFYPGDTERPKPLLRKLFLNIALDQKDIFTSPFHVNRHNALGLAGADGSNGSIDRRRYPHRECF